MTFSLDTISARLESCQPPELDPGAIAETKTKAAVAMILRQGARGPELLFIWRALHENDPWSGNVAFPGGKVEKGEEPRQAAERETAEETGIDLGQAVYLGEMPVVRGSYLPVRVSCFVYWFGETVPDIKINGEVQDIFWAALDDLDDREQHTMARVIFRNDEFESPGIVLSPPGWPVLWGLTYRLVMHFLDLVRS